MKKPLRAALAAFFLLHASAPALADTRINWDYGVQPKSQWLLYQERYHRLADGSLRFAILGTSGTYKNLSVTATSGLYVQVAPTSSNSTGLLFQYLADDAVPFGGGPISTSDQLAADPTQIQVQGIATAALAAIGPLSVPVSDSQISLIECQVSTVDSSSTSGIFIDGSGNISTQTFNRDRPDNIACQAKAGTASSSPTIPAADTGWLGIGYVTIPSGTATITSGMIHMLPALGSVVTQDSSGNASISGTLTAGSMPLQFPNTAGSSSSTYIRGDGTITVRGVTGTVWGVQSAPIGSASITVDASANVGIAGTIYSGSIIASGASSFGPNGKITLDDDATNGYVKSPASIFFYSNTSGTAKVAQYDTSGNWQIPGHLSASTAAPVCGSTLPCTVSLSCALSSSSSCTATASVPAGAACKVNWSGSSIFLGKQFEIDNVGVSSSTLSATAEGTSPSTGTASMTALCS